MPDGRSADLPRSMDDTMRMRNAEGKSVADTQSTNTRAIAWSVSMGLVPGYAGDRYDDSPWQIEKRRALLHDTWEREMAATLAETGFTISVVMTDGKVVYPADNGCPVGGETVVVLSGSSNPKHVSPDRFDDYVAAVEAMILRVQDAMDQTSVRIEFVELYRSVYSRVEKTPALAA